MHYPSFVYGLFAYHGVLVACRAYQVYKHRNDPWNKPIVEKIDGNKVTFDLSPIPLEYRSFYTHDAKSAYMLYNKLYVRFRDMGNSCIEINQHHFWTKDLAKE